MSPDDVIEHGIDSLIRSNDVLLFLKGSRKSPQCGFSGAVVRILDHLIPDYSTVDVLRDEALREGIKAHSSWSTVPQLYVRGEFVGGCDSVRELYASGELHRILGVDVGQVKAPRIGLTDGAAEALRATAEEHAGSGRTLRLTIDASYQSCLAIGPEEPGETIVEAHGVKLAMDLLTALRADGAQIQALHTAHGQGFRIEIPGAPRAHALSVRDLERKIGSGERFELLDVRTPEEQARASLPGAVPLSEEALRRIESLPRSTTLVFFSHRGRRARAAAEHFAAGGFTQIHWVEGGIDAWSQHIDPDLPRY
jgi:monothiol glutaredoxin